MHLPRIFALVALLIAFAPSARAAPMEADAGPVIATEVRATPPAATAPAPAPAELAPTVPAPSAIAWLRADPLGWPNWQIIAALAWLALTALLKASSRLRANEPLELVANVLVRVPLVGQLARAWTTPGRPEPAREPRDPGMPAAGAALVLAMLSVALPARADEPPPQLAPTVAHVPLDAPVAAQPPQLAPQSPSISQVLACTVAGIPDAVGRCAVDPGKVAPIDSRVFWTTLAGGVGANLTTIGAWLITHYLPSEPLK